MTPSGLSKDVIATVVDNSAESKNGKVEILASNFRASVDDVNNFKLNDGAQSRNKLVSLSNAEAYDTSDRSEIGISRAVSEIKAARGKYQVRFTSNPVDNEDATIAVEATVTDKTLDTGKEMLSANNFEIGVGEVTTLTTDKVKTLADAYAYDIATGREVPFTSVNFDAIRPLKGSYDVSFTTEAGNTITVSAYVRDEAIDMPDINEHLTANNFTLDIEDAQQAIDYYDDQILVEAAGAKASNTATGLSVDVFVNRDYDKTTLKAAKGIYDVTFTTSKGSTLKVKATVVDSKSQSKTGKAAIAANNFIASLDEVKENELTSSRNGKDELIKLAGAKAWNKENFADLDIQSVNSGIEEAKGVYDVGYTSAPVDGESATIHVDATITDKHGSAGGIKILANHFSIGLDEVKGLDDTKVKRLANVVAFREDGMQEVQIDSVDRTAIQAKKGWYDVIFTAGEASVTVRARVYDNGSENIVNKEHISANEIRISVADATTAQTDDNILIKAANATAYSTETGENVAVSVDRNPKNTTIQPIVGRYKVTFKTLLGTNVQVLAAVVESSSGSENGYAEMIASDFRVSIDDVETQHLNDPEQGREGLIDFAGARAYNTEDRSEIGFANVTTTILAAKGDYKVGFETEKVQGESATDEVDAKVTDHAVRDADTGLSLSANNFTVASSEVEELKKDENKDTIAKLAEFYAYDAASGMEVSYNSVDTRDMKAERGIYYVKFTCRSKSITVDVTVTDGSQDNEETRERVYGNDFALTRAEAASILDKSMGTDEQILDFLVKKGSAAAINMDDMSSVPITGVDYGALLAEVGRYPVTFSTEKGSTKTVYVSVTEEIIIKGDVGIYAEDFTVSKEEVEKYRLDDSYEGRTKLIELSGANAWNKLDFSVVNIKDVISEIQAKKGKYSVKFTAEDEEGNVASITIQVSVTESSTDPDPGPDQPDPDDPEFVDIKAYANNFDVSMTDVTKYNLGNGSDPTALAKLVEFAEVTAYTKIGKLPVEIASATSTIEAKRGEYTVSFTTAEVKGKTVTVEVKARVFDRRAEENENTQYRIFANDFTLSKAEADALREGKVYSTGGKTTTQSENVYATELTNWQKEIVRLANASIYRIEDGLPSTFKGVFFIYNGNVGQHEAQFEAENGEIMKVVVTVTDQGSENVGNKERIFANNVNLTKDEAEKLLAKSNDEISKELISKSKAHAVNTETGFDVDIDPSRTTWTLKKDAGNYAATYSTTRGTRVTADVKVTGEKLHKVTVQISGKGNLKVNNLTKYPSTVEDGKSLSFAWNSGASGSNIYLPESVTISVAGKSVYTYDIVKDKKTTWLDNNTYWKSRMGETKKFATYNKIVAAANKGASYTAKNIKGDVVVKINFKLMAPVYRLYNMLTSEHLFTKSKSEYDNFAKLCAQKKDYWVPEGCDWLAPAESTGNTAVYRLYNPGLGAMGHSSHYYSSDVKEVANLVNKWGWKYDFGGAAAFYSGGTQPIYTCYNEALRSAHHYTSSYAEYSGLKKHGWDLEESKNKKNGKWVGVMKCITSSGGTSV